MANTGFKGIDVRQTGTALVFRAFFQTSSGALVTSGTTNLYLMELQSDGTIKTYDFNDNTFKSTACTTENLALTYRKSNNAATDTGLWTAALATLTGFTAGSIYLARVNNSGASPTDQLREFQFGSEQGDLAVIASGTTGVAYIKSDPEFWKGGLIPAVNVTGIPKVDLVDILGTASAGAAGYVGVDWGQITNKTTANVLSGTTISSSQVAASVTAVVSANVTQWTGNAVAATHVNGVPIVDVGYVIGNAAAVSNGTAQAGANGSITLASSEPATNGFYVGRQVTIVAGTAVGQARFVTAYNGSTKVATVHRNWDVNPDATSQYSIDSLVETNVYQFAGQNAVLDGNNLPNVNAKDWNGAAITTSTPNTASVTVTAISAGIAAADVWGAARSGFTTAGTFGQAVAAVNANVTVGGYAASQDPGTYVLSSAANKLTTDSTGRVLLQPTQSGVTIPTVTTVGTVTNTVAATVSGNVTVGGYATGQDPATIVLVTPANKLATDSMGRVLLQPTQSGVTIPTVTAVTTANLNLSQSVPTSNTAQTVGDALNAARAQGFGKWQLVGTTLTLYAPDGTTAVRTFSLDSVSAPTVRT